MRSITFNNASLWGKTDQKSIWYKAPENRWYISSENERDTIYSPDMFVPISSPDEECPDTVQDEWRLYDGIGYLQLPSGYVFVDCVKGKHDTMGRLYTMNEGVITQFHHIFKSFDIVAFVS